MQNREFFHFEEEILYSFLHFSHIFVVGDLVHSLEQYILPFLDIAEILRSNCLQHLMHETITEVFFNSLRILPWHLWPQYVCFLCVGI